MCVWMRSFSCEKRPESGVLGIKNWWKTRFSLLWNVFQPLNSMNTEHQAAGDALPLACQAGIACCLHEWCSSFRPLPCLNWRLLHMSLQIHPKTAKDLLRRCVCAVCVFLFYVVPLHSSLISTVPDVGFWFTPIDGPDMTLKCLLCEKRTFKANADCVRKHVTRYHEQDYYNHLPSNGMCVLLNFIFFFSFFIGYFSIT